MNSRPSRYRAWRRCATGLLTLLWCVVARAQTIEFSVVDADSREPVAGALVYVDEGSVSAVSDAAGVGQLRLPPAGEDYARVVCEVLGYRTAVLPWGRFRENPLIVLEPTAVKLREVLVADRSRLGVSNGRLRDVEGTAIYAGRKTELILPSKLDGNLATNNAREIFRSVAGLTVWENDAAGLQLSIGARGLDPNRTSNFNARQNGFDISADALGYPESYYTPPAQALERIEVVRGAASLQYGTQFGGLLNFKLKQATTGRPLAVESEQTVGSYGLVNSFNAVSGTLGRLRYYGFGQYKRADAWRDNSGFAQTTSHVNAQYSLAEATELGVEVTHMRYLARQAGGLLDFEFAQDPRQSKRERNWFRVDWTLAALHFDHALSATTKVNVRTFVLNARRDALGELGPINRPDPGRERDLIRGRFRNFGQEGRLLHRYSVGGQPASLLLGYRYYSGSTQHRQGLGTDGRDADFRFNNPGRLERSDYDFPSRNYAVFAEQLLKLGERWSLTPGLRFEWIRTSADGYYRRTVRAGNEVLLDEQIEERLRNTRGFLLGGLGLSYRRSERLEAYANASQNYRAINFSDLVIVNPNLVIDSALTDERGYNAELGLRGNHPEGTWRFDVSLFYLRYANRIGIREVLLPDPVSVERLASLRTNIGAADVAGVEAFAEVDLVPVLGWAAVRGLSLRPFVNFSALHARYASGGPAVEGKHVELVPPLTLKTGIAGAYGRWRGQLMLTRVAEHFTDATNATRVADATRGTIPAYAVVDLSASYAWGRWRVQAGANNLLDARYFTRRAQGYPGPGIIPAEARSAYFGLRVRI